MGSLQEALLKSGVADDKQPERKKSPRKPPKQKSPAGNKRPGGKKKSVRRSSDSDLARAYAARRKAEAAEEERKKRARLADQEARRKRNLELDQIVAGQALNSDDGEIPRYFEHLGRIRRVSCTREQRAAVNAGQLGVVSLRGRYLIVAPDVLEAYRAVAPDLVPDLSGREPEEDGATDYPPVPDELTW